MKFTLTAVTALSVLLVSSVFAQVIVPNVKGDSLQVKDHENRPKLDLTVTDKGDYKIKEVVFTKEQLSVMFKEIYILNPNVVLRIAVSKEAKQQRIIDLLKTAVSANLSEVIFKKLQE